MESADADKAVEIPITPTASSGRNSRGAGDGASKPTARTENSYPQPTQRLDAVVERKNLMAALRGVNVFFPNRTHDRAIVALVTNDIHLSMKKIVHQYLRRWAIEVMIKEQKQHLGLGDYRVWRYRAID